MSLGGILPNTLGNPVTNRLDEAIPGVSGTLGSELILLSRRGLCKRGTHVSGHPVFNIERAESEVCPSV